VQATHSKNEMATNLPRQDADRLIERLKIRVGIIVAKDMRRPQQSS
jgi:hypothetical protein